VILVDTSVWVDHLRRGDPRLVSLLDAGSVLAHPFVIGELALGDLKQRDLILTSLHDLLQAVVATDREVLHFIEQHRLFGAGIGYLLAAASLTSGAALRTRDRRLAEVANALALAANLDG
jgi:predicted nucleic acid-binding protein